MARGRVSFDDRVSVMMLIARIAHLADDGDPAEYADCFTEDARWRLADAAGSPMPAQTLTGRGAILAGVLERRAAGIQGPGSHTMHDVSCVEVSIDGDAATARSSFRYYRNTDGEPHLTMIGVYEDVITRDGDRWRLAHRVIRQR